LTKETLRRAFGVGIIYPRIDKYFDEISPDVVNSILACKLHDSLVFSWREVIRQQRSPLQAIHKILELKANNLKMIEKSGSLALLTSYKKIIANSL
jgi:hypothetical protein